MNELEKINNDYFYYNLLYKIIVIVVIITLDQGSGSFVYCLPERIVFLSHS